MEAIKQIAETERDAAQELLTDLETYGDKDVEGTDWKAEVDAITAELDKLNAQLDVLDTQLDQAHATPEYLAAYQAVNGVWKDEPNTWSPSSDMEKGVDYKEVVENGKVVGYEVLVEKGALQILNDANEALMDKQKEKLFFFFFF